MGPRKASLDIAATMKCIKDYVETQQHYRNANLTSSDVANALSLSRTSLTKVLHVSLSMTFSEYLIQCRLKHARRYIIRTPTPHSVEVFEKAALLYGFKSYRNFKKHYNTFFNV